MTGIAIDDTAGAAGTPTVEVQVLVVRAAGAGWALPMSAVEQVFDLAEHPARAAGSIEVVRFHDQTLEIFSLAQRLGLDAGAPSSGVVVWTGGRRCAITVDELIGQVTAPELELPPLARSRFVRGLIMHQEEIVPIVEISALITGLGDEQSDRHGFSDMQQSALAEVANIGSGHAATALSTMLGKPVEVGFSKAVLTSMARALDGAGAAMARSALVTTPIHGDGGAMLLIFPEDTAEELCQLLGTTMEDPLGPTALQEVGNILSSSYMNAIVEMTGLDLEPDPPSVGIDLLGRLLADSGVTDGDPNDPTVLMRSHLTIEGSTARFSFLFVPRFSAVDQLLQRLGVGD